MEEIHGSQFSMKTHVSINKMMAKKGTGKWLNIFNIADSRNFSMEGLIAHLIIKEIRMK